MDQLTHAEDKVDQLTHAEDKDKVDQLTHAEGQSRADVLPEQLSTKSDTTDSDIFTWDPTDDRLLHIDERESSKVQSINDYLCKNIKEVKQLVEILVNKKGAIAHTDDVFDYMLKSYRFPVAFQAAVKSRGIGVRATISTAMSFVDKYCLHLLQPKHKKLHRLMAIDFLLNLYFTEIRLAKKGLLQRVHQLK